MNENTKIALKSFATAVEDLAHACSSAYGLDALIKIKAACAALRAALDKDETVP